LREVSGTVERVDRVNHRVDLADLSIYYEPPRVGNEERRFHPEDVRPGDRIRAEVEPTYAGLMIRRLEVLAKATGEPAPEGPEASAARRGPEAGEAPQIREEDQGRAGSLRGRVRYVDTSSRAVDVEASAAGSGRPGLVRVLYDADTRVAFQGKSVSPENLQLGDRVEITLRGQGTPPVAEQIVILSGEPTENH
jgi:hypothetical protein